MDVTIWIEPSLGLSVTKRMEPGSTIAALKRALVEDDVLGSLTAEDILLVAKGVRSEALGDERLLGEELLELEFGSAEELGAGAQQGQQDSGGQWQEGQWQEPAAPGWDAAAAEEARRKEEELQWQRWAQEEEQRRRWAEEEERKSREAQEEEARQRAAWKAEEARWRMEEEARQTREWQEWAAKEEERKRWEEEQARQKAEFVDEEERERQRRAKKRAEDAEKRKAEQEALRLQREEEERERKRRAAEDAEAQRLKKEEEQKAMQKTQTIKNTAAGARKLLGNPLQYRVVLNCPAYSEPTVQASKSPAVRKGAWVLGFPGSAAWVQVDRRTQGLPSEALVMKEIWMPVKSQDENGGPGEPVLHANWSDLRAEGVADSSLDVVWPGVGQPAEPNTAEYSVDWRLKQEPPAKPTPACGGTSKTRFALSGLEKDSEIQVRVTLRIVGPYSTNFRIFGVWADFRTARSGTELCSVNKALGRPAKASSAKSVERQACHAVDGNATTRWTSIYEDNQWVSVDLGAKYSLLRVEIRWEAAHAQHYLLQGSPDEHHWTTMASEIGREGWVMTTLPSDSAARYVRMFGKTRATQFGFSMYEMKVFALDDVGNAAEVGTASEEMASEEQMEAEGEGVYEVVHNFVTLRAEPSTKGTIRGTIKKGWHVFGTPFRIGGQPWTKLSAQTIPPVEKSLPPRNITEGESAWALIDATGVPGLGLGELLRRVGDAAGAEGMRKLGEWKVLGEKVAFRERPSMDARPSGHQRKGAKVVGVCFPIDGVLWLRVQNPPGMEGPDLWAQVEGGEEGQARLLERLRDAPESSAKSRQAALPASTRPPPPKPLTAAWLAAHGGLPKPPLAVREALLDADVDVGMASQCTLLCVKPTDGGAEFSCVAKRGATNGDMGSCEKEYRFYSQIARRGAAAGAPQPEMLGGVLRVPRCFCANWGKEGKEREAFILILEMLGKPDWIHVDPELGCTLEQAVTAVEALGRMHKVFSDKKILDEFSWLPVTVFDVRNAAQIQQYFSMTIDQAGALVQMLPPSAQAAVDRMAQGGLGECFERLGEPPLTLNHGDYRPENLRFSAPGQPTAVSAFDWGLVNCARGVADFAYFLMLSQPPEQRRQWQWQLLEKYLRARGDYSERVMKETTEDLKSASLAILGMILMTRHGVSYGGFTQGTRIMLSRMMRWVGEAIMDWKSIDVLPL